MTSRRGGGRASRATTDSDHDRPIFPLVAKGFEAHGPDQLRVADITYVAIATGYNILRRSTSLVVPPRSWPGRSHGIA